MATPRSNPPPSPKPKAQDDLEPNPFLPKISLATYGNKFDLKAHCEQLFKVPEPDRKKS